MQLAEFLRRSTRIRVDTDCRVDDGVRLIDAVESALACDAVVALLTPAAVASRASGVEWESLLGPASGNATHPLLAVKIEPCPAPAMLRRRAPADATLDAFEAWRTVKQWLLRTFWPAENPVDAAAEASPAEIEELRESVADRPGAALAPSPAVMREFVRRCWRDFERVVLLDCHWRTPVSLASELGARLGVPMEGPEDACHAALEQALREPRLLLALEGLDDGSAVPAGDLCSIVHTEYDPPPMPTPDEIVAVMRHWHTDPAAALAMTPAASECFARTAWDAAREFGRLAFLLLNRERRYAEAFEWCGRLSRRAVKEGDRAVLEEAEREKAWILARWEGAPVEPPGPDMAGEQLSLFD